MKTLSLGLAAIAMALSTPAAAAEIPVWSTNFDEDNLFQFISPFASGGYTVNNTDVPFDFASSGTGPGLGSKYFAKNVTSVTSFSAGGLGAHTALRLKFDLIFADSWDSTNGSPSPDTLTVNIDGTEYVLTAANASGTIDNFGPGTLRARGAFLGLTGAFMDNDAIVGFDLLIPHTDAFFEVTFQAGGNGWQGRGDESWGLDNWSLSAITSDGPVVPEPATWAMMIAGFGLVGAVARRRRAPLAA
jgi:hypothetical protein